MNIIYLQIRLLSIQEDQTAHINTYIETKTFNWGFFFKLKSFIEIHIEKIKYH